MCHILAQVRRALTSYNYSYTYISHWVGWQQWRGARPCCRLCRGRCRCPPASPNNQSQVSIESLDQWEKSILTLDQWEVSFQTLDQWEPSIQTLDQSQLSIDTHPGEHQVRALHPLLPTRQQTVLKRGQYCLIRIFHWHWNCSSLQDVCCYGVGRSTCAVWVQVKTLAALSFNFTLLNNQTIFRKK